MIPRGVCQLLPLSLAFNAEKKLLDRMLGEREEADPVSGAENRMAIRSAWAGHAWVGRARALAV